MFNYGIYWYKWSINKMKVLKKFRFKKLVNIFKFENIMRNRLYSIKVLMGGI